MNLVEHVQQNGVNYWALGRAKANQEPVMSESKILKMAKGYRAADLKVKYLDGWVEKYPDATNKSLYMLMNRRGLITEK